MVVSIPADGVKCMDGPQLQSLLEGSTVNIYVGNELVVRKVPRVMLYAFSEEETLREPLSNPCKFLTMKDHYSSAAVSTLIGWMAHICSEGKWVSFPIASSRLRNLELYAVAALFHVTEAEKALYQHVRRNIRDLTFAELSEIARHFPPDHKWFRAIRSYIAQRNQLGKLSLGEKRFLESSPEYKALVEERDHEVTEERFNAKLWEENSKRFTLWCRNTQMDRKIKKLEAELEAELEAIDQEGDQQGGEGKLCELYGETVASGLSALSTGFPTNTNAS